MLQIGKWHSSLSVVKRTAAFVAAACCVPGWLAAVAVAAHLTAYTKLWKLHEELDSAGREGLWFMMSFIEATALFAASYSPTAPTVLAWPLWVLSHGIYILWTSFMIAAIYAETIRTRLEVFLISSWAMISSGDMEVVIRIHNNRITVRGNVIPGAMLMEDEIEAVAPVQTGATEPPEGREECTVCQEDIGAELWRLLPCEHAFHAPCVDPWLQAHGTCPTCRTPVITTAETSEEEEEEIEEGSEPGSE